MCLLWRFGVICCYFWTILFHGAQWSVSTVRTWRPVCHQQTVQVCVTGLECPWRHFGSAPSPERLPWGRAPTPSQPGWSVSDVTGQPHGASRENPDYSRQPTAGWRHKSAVQPPTLWAISWLSVNATTEHIGHNSSEASQRQQRATTTVWWPATNTTFMSHYNTLYVWTSRARRSFQRSVGGEQVHQHFSLDCWQ